MTLNKITNHRGIPFQQLTIQDAVNNIKLDYDNAVASGTTINSVRTSTLIKYVHDAIKTDFLKASVHPSLINPSKKYLQTVINPSTRAYNRQRPLLDKELQLFGFLKTKNQDISIIPDNISITPTILTLNTMLNGRNDIYGHIFTESILSVNVRSQLSSLDKNFDTMYERIFAESLNLHLRLPNMVLGEVYLIPTQEYDVKTGGFTNTNLEKYIKAFQAINMRKNKNDDNYKYERCSLLIVSFNRTIPKIYNTTQELIQDGFLSSTSSCSLVNLDYPNFINDILQIYKSRFPTNTFI